MLLINLQAWRSDDVTRRIVDWLSTNPERIGLADQDAINACLCDRVTSLPDCWNLQIGIDSGPIAAARLNDAVLLHYDGAHKPWRFRFRGPGAARWHRTPKISGGSGTNTRFRCPSPCAARYGENP